MPHHVNMLATRRRTVPSPILSCRANQTVAETAGTKIEHPLPSKNSLWPAHRQILPRPAVNILAHLASFIQSWITFVPQYRTLLDQLALEFPQSLLRDTSLTQFRQLHLILLIYS